MLSQSRSLSSWLHNWMDDYHDNIQIYHYSYFRNLSSYIVMLSLMILNASSFPLNSSTTTDFFSNFL